MRFPAKVIHACRDKSRASPRFYLQALRQHFSLMTMNHWDYLFYIILWHTGDQTLQSDSMRVFVTHLCRKPDSFSALFIWRLFGCGKSLRIIIFYN